MTNKSQVWLYERVQRVPSISDKQIALMRHIHPVLRVGESSFFRRIEGIEKVDPRTESFLWDAKPCGDEFTFDTSGQTTVITQHHSSVFFKPSLAEVYAWIRFYMGEHWPEVKCFCMGDAERIGASTDIWCKCVLLGGDEMVRGDRVRFADGSIGHYLVKRQQGATT